MYQEYNSNDLWNKEAPGNSVDNYFQRFLLRNFSETTAKTLYGMCINTIAIFAKIGVFVSLPFKFLQFFRQSWRNQKNKNINRDK